MRIKKNGHNGAKVSIETIKLTKEYFFCFNFIEISEFSVCIRYVLKVYEMNASLLLKYTVNKISLKKQPLD